MIKRARIGWPEQNTGQKIADLGHCRQKRREAHQAAAGTAGLLSFALPHVARRRSAANRARKAAAAKHKLQAQAHVPVPPVPGTRLAMVETEIVLGALKARLNR